MHRIIAFLVVLLTALSVASTAQAYNISGPQFERVLEGRSEPTWAPDNDIGARINSLRDNGYPVHSYAFVSPGRYTDIVLGYGSQLEADVRFFYNTRNPVTGQIVTRVVVRHFFAFANPNRNPEAKDGMELNGNVYWGPGGY